MFFRYIHANVLHIVQTVITPHIVEKTQKSNTRVYVSQVTLICVGFLKRIINMCGLLNANDRCHLQLIHGNIKN